jgi:hypothetical protein
MLAAWAFFCVALVELGRCADRASMAQFAAHAATHPDLLQGEQVGRFKALLAEKRREEERQVAAAATHHCSRLHRAACGFRRHERLGVHFMNATFLCCYHSQRRPPLRPVSAHVLGSPIIRSLSFLPSAALTAVLVRLLDLLCIDTSAQRSTAKAASARMLPGRVRVQREPLRPCDPEEFSAAEAAIESAARTRNPVLIAWRLRSVIVEVWRLLVSWRGGGGGAYS